MLSTQDEAESTFNQKSPKGFIHILSPHTDIEQSTLLSQSSDLKISKVYLKRINQQPYLQITKKCSDHSSKVSYLQTFNLQYHLSHAAIMCPIRLSISTKNEFEAYYNFPENGVLSEFVGFSHDNFKNDKNLTPTQKSIISYGIAHALNSIHKQGYFFNTISAKNVYLDSDYHPYLTNFYSARKINVNECLPVKGLTENHLKAVLENAQKIDILAYSILYSALIEPIEMDPPVSSSTEFYQSLGKRSRPVCKNATENQKKVLNMMWDFIPKYRIDFDKVIEYFENGDLVFPGTDEDQFNEYKKYVNEFNEEQPMPLLSPPASRSPSTDSFATELPDTAAVKKSTIDLVNRNIRLKQEEKSGEPLNENKEIYDINVQNETEEHNDKSKEEEEHNDESKEEEEHNDELKEEEEHNDESKEEEEHNDESKEKEEHNDESKEKEEHNDESKEEEEHNDESKEEEEHNDESKENEENEQNITNGDEQPWTIQEGEEPATLQEENEENAKNGDEQPWTIPEGEEPATLQEDEEQTAASAETQPEEIQQAGNEQNATDEPPIWALQDGEETTVTSAEEETQEHNDKSKEEEEHNDESKENEENEQNITNGDEQPWTLQEGEEPATLQEDEEQTAASAETQPEEIQQAGNEQNATDEPPIWALQDGEETTVTSAEEDTQEHNDESKEEEEHNDESKEEEEHNDESKEEEEHNDKSKEEEEHNDESKENEENEQNITNGDEQPWTIQEGEEPMTLQEENEENAKNGDEQPWTIQEGEEPMTFQEENEQNVPNEDEQPWTLPETTVISAEEEQVDNANDN